MQLTNESTIKNFLNYLLTSGKSKISIKNYKSDISHFLAWAVLKLKSFGTYAESFLEITPFINRDFFTNYKNFMIENGTKTKTINRRLSTLRGFSRYLASEQIIDLDFMEGIQNTGIGIPTKVQEKTQDIVEKFRESLTKNKKTKPNTVKNYISDVRSFLAWTSELDAANRKGDLPNGV